MAHPYTLHDVAEVFSPALVFFPSLIRANIARVVEMAGSPSRLRPHVKTHKTREIAAMQLAAGVTKHKCATIAEAELLASAGAPDVLLAYPVVGPTIGRLASLARHYPAVQFSALADQPHGVEAIAQAAAQAGRTIGALVDLDVGQHRTGIAVGENALALYEQIARTAGLRAEGLHAYDGHNHQEAETDRLAAARASLGPVLELRSELERRGHTVPRIVAGGTPTFPMYAAMTDIPGLECSPGTYVLHDHGYGSKYHDLSKVTPAAVLVGRVISKPTSNRVTFDLGTKAVASDPPLARRIHLLDAPEHTPVAQNEEHYIIETPHADRYQPGDVVYALPGHICPTVALHKEALIAEGGKVVGRWQIVGRDRFITI